MIRWSIECALNSKLFDRVIVSTDDIEIADIAKKAGAEIPFLRPETLANDYADTLSVIKHTVEQLINDGYNFDVLCCLYATSPLTETEDVIKSIKRLDEVDNKIVFPVTEYDFPIQRAVRIKDNGEGEDILQRI